MAKTKSYVDSVLDAAAMASRADTLDGMLNQLPGLLMEQEQQKRAEATEADRYNEQIGMQRIARTDNIKRQDEASDLQFLNVAASIEDPTEQDAFLKTYKPLTERGRLGFNSLQASNDITKGRDSAVNIKFREFNANKKDFTLEEYNIKKDELEADVNSSVFLQNKYGKSIIKLDAFGKIIGGRESANALLETSLFTGTEEEKKEFQDAIRISVNPMKQIETILNNLDTDKMTDKERATVISDLSNSAAQLENAGDTSGAATVSAYRDKMISESSGSTKDDGEVGEVQNLTEAEKAAMVKQYGNQSMILIPDAEKNGQVLVNMDNGTQQDVPLDYKISDAEKRFGKGVKSLEQERDEYKVLYINAKSQSDRIKYKKLMDKTNKAIKAKQQSKLPFNKNIENFRGKSLKDGTYPMKEAVNPFKDFFK